MAKQLKIFPYTNSKQVFTMPTGYDRYVTYHCWGGGGGAGGDSGEFYGGNGSAGSYTTGSMVINPGDTVEIYVGGGGKEGRFREGKKKLYSATITGNPSSGVGPAATYGFVTDPTKAIYPQYSGALRSRTWNTWSSFMQTWAVSDIPDNRAGEETVENNIYFPYAGTYQIQTACDNSITVDFRGTRFNLANNFKGNPDSRNITVPAAGTYTLTYTLRNETRGSGNPAGAAIVITGKATSAMGPGDIITYTGGVSLKNIIWTTRNGPNLDLTDRVPILYAPVVNFYQPQSGYDFGGVPDRGMAFLSDTSTWTEEELAKLNLSFGKVITIAQPVQIYGRGNIDQVIRVGYYTFKRGQTWDLARYNWLGNPFNNNNLPAGAAKNGTPASWTQRADYNDNRSGRSKDVNFCAFDLPIPKDDEIFIIGYADGIIYNAPSQKGSDNITFTVQNLTSQTYVGGAGGNSAVNIGSGKFNYYGGYGGQIGSQSLAGGGGGGGGATIISIATSKINTTTTYTVPNGLVANYYEQVAVAKPSQVWLNEVTANKSTDCTTFEIDQVTLPGYPRIAEDPLKAFYFQARQTELCQNFGTSPVYQLSGLDSAGRPKPFTLEAWIRASGPGSQPTWGGAFMNKDYQYSAGRLQDGRIVFAVDWGQGNWNSAPDGGLIITNIVLPVNVTALVSAVFFNNDAIVYIDGVKRWQASVDGFPMANGQISKFVWRYNCIHLDRPYRVGNNSLNNRRWQGYVGDVRLWNIARTQQEIQRTLYGIPYVQIVREPTVIGAATAGGGAGGGGAGSKAEGQNGSNESKEPTRYQNSIGAGQTGESQLSRGGGGGGGGGGCNGGAGGAAADGKPLGVAIDGTAGRGGFKGGSQVVPKPQEIPEANFLMVGRGGDGGSTGGGGGAGALAFGEIRLRTYQYIQVGGTGGDKLPDGMSAIWFNEKEYFPVGPGGLGGSVGAPYSPTGNGQNGGCTADNVNKATTTGSGGGAGVGRRTGSAAGGVAGTVGRQPNVGIRSTLYYTNGGSASGATNGLGAGGGGGGAGSAGVSGNSRGGDGGRGRILALGKTGATYNLAGGGGGAASLIPTTAINFGQGFGQSGGGDGGSGSNDIEFTKPGTYRFRVPRNTSSIVLEAVAGGGAGAARTPTGGGGGGSGGYLTRTSYNVGFGQEIEIVVGAGGRTGGSNGVNTRIRILEAGSNTALHDIILGGGRGGVGGTPAAPGGIGGTPNGNQGEAGSQGEKPNYIGGRGADSPLGEGGQGGGNYQGGPKATNGGRGAGGGGSATGSKYSSNPGFGGDGYVYLAWNGDNILDAQPNTGSGGGGGFDGPGGSGGSGFVVIAYPGQPAYRFVVNGKVVPPISQGGYTIHECRQSGELLYGEDVKSGEINLGDGIYPGGTNVQGYIPGTGVGGVGNEGTDVFPCVQSAAYPLFLNQNGVWNQDPNTPKFERTYQVFFPKTGRYIFKGYADNGAVVKIDGGTVLDMSPPTRGNNSYWYKTGAEETPRITEGLHQLSISATNLTTFGAFALTITDQTNSNIEIFNSRRPPVAAGSPNGGNGLVILEFSGGVGTAQVKVDGGWKKLIGQFVKVNNVWKPFIASAVKVNGAWRSLFGALPIPVVESQDNWGGPKQPPTPQPPSSGGGGGSGTPNTETPGPNNPIWLDKSPAEITIKGPEGPDTTPRPAPAPSTPPDSGGGGGGGGCKVICQKLAELGYFDTAMNEADQAFGVLLRDGDPDAYNGYLRWAGPVVDLLEGKGSATFRKVVFPWIRDEQKRKDLQIKIVAYYLDGIARPWAEEMAYRMGAKGYEKSNPAGRVIMDIGLPMCRLVARFNRGGSMPMWAKTALIWGTTTILLGMVTVISTTSKLYGKIKNFFKRG